MQEWKVRKDDRWRGKEKLQMDIFLHFLLSQLKIKNICKPLAGYPIINSNLSDRNTALKSSALSKSWRNADSDIEE